MLMASLPTIGFFSQGLFITSLASVKARRGKLTNSELVTGSGKLRRAFERVGVRFEISGDERLGELTGPVVFVANHMSPLETQVLPTILAAAAPCTFVVKPSLLAYPLFGRVLKAFDPIVVSRTDPKGDLEVVLREGKARLRQGISVIVFPQAQRTPGFDPKAFNTLGMRLARAAGVSMVPVALDTAAWRPGRLFKDFGRIDPSRPTRFAIGPPVPVGSNGMDAHRQVVSFIEERFADWSDQA